MGEVSIREDIIREALREDIGEGDITTDTLFPQSIPARAKIISREEGVLCGIEIARGVFLYLNPKMIFPFQRKDGEEIKAGEVVLEIEGDGRDILKGERTALNFLSHLSGIATLTRRFVEMAQGVEIRDTRKTLPGLRELEKYAVRVGGGKNHRMGLYDMILIKDNHLALLGKDRLSSIEEALEKVKGRGSPVEIEVSSVKEAELAARKGAEIIMLDNMEEEELEEAVRRVKEINPRIIVEVSGGVNLKTLRKFLKKGVDWISSGYLTHSAPSLDFSLELERV